MKLPTHNRYDYIPLPDRKTYDWPKGARLAVTASAQKTSTGRRGACVDARGNVLRASEAS